jgi:hypothetical protein
VFLVDAWLRAERQGKHSSIPDRRKCCLKSRMSRSILEVNRPPVQYVLRPRFCTAKRPGQEPLCLLPNLTSTPSYDHARPSAI